MIASGLCLADEHDLRLVALALLICLLGSAGTVQLFARIRSTGGAKRLGWLLLCSVGTGTMVWSTHFVAMMTYAPRVPVTLDATMTMASLAVAILLAGPGLAAMHYVHGDLRLAEAGDRSDAACGRHQGADGVAGR